MQFRCDGFRLPDRGRARRRTPFVLTSPVVAYGLAWIGHVLVEKNTPATFRHPLRSLVADFHMYGLMWAGRMDAEARRLAALDEARHEAPPDGRGARGL